MKTMLTKEEYNNFIAAWKAATNSEKNKKSLERKSYTIKSSTYEYTVVKPALVQAHHHIIYNVLRGREPTCGFTPTTNERRLTALDPWYGFNEAVRCLRVLREDWKYMEPKEPMSYSEYRNRNSFWSEDITKQRYERYKKDIIDTSARRNARIARLTEPFGTALTFDRLVSILKQLDGYTPVNTVDPN